MDKPHHQIPDVDVLPAHFPLPGMGFLPINAFVIKAAEPVLVDAGIAIDSDDFMEALQSVIDPADLKWIWLTHDDADHTGSIQRVLQAAPNARLAAHCLAVLRLSTAWDVPMHRVYWLSSGDSISAGDRTLTALRPPLFDNPTTIGLYDSKSQAFFSADCFGAVIPSPAQNADDVAPEDFAQGMLAWATADSPWVHLVPTNEFIATLDRIRQMGPKMIFSAHAPPAQGKVQLLLDLLAKVPASPPFVAPNQTALEQILAQTTSAD
jgi:flavorubredoxin